MQPGTASDNMAIQQIRKIIMDLDWDLDKSVVTAHELTMYSVTPMAASRPESLSQAVSAILSKGEPRFCNAFRYLASS